MRPMMTHAELDALLPKMKSFCEKAEADTGIQPLPLMTVEECEKYMVRLFDGNEWSTIAGQLLACYRMAVQAETLGKKDGRWLCINEDDALKMAAELD